MVFYSISGANVNFSSPFCLQKQKTGGRTKALLDTVPVQKLADIFVASFEISFEEQLAMLDSVDLKTRLSKATELVDRHLQVVLCLRWLTLASSHVDASFRFYGDMNLSVLTFCGFMLVLHCDSPFV